MIVPRYKGREECGVHTDVLVVVSNDSVVSENLINTIGNFTTLCAHGCDDCGADTTSVEIIC